MLAYRADIDGMRAVAVVSVILFHAALPGFRGGYVGVDVFFVISGYLISLILLKSLETGKWSIADFYERRIRRIFPPLFLMFGASWLLSLVFLLPSEQARFARTMLGAVLFSANLLFARTANYFEPATDTKVLLHTWSLCVEEQFYLVFPPLFVYFFRKGGRPLRIAVTIAWLASFALSAVSVRLDQRMAFFLSPTRAWELLTGTMLALGMLPKLQTTKARNVAALTGTVALAASVYSFSEDTIFPGPWALVPCLATALVIHAGSSGDHLVKRMLTHRALVAIGLLSYGLYLWHWPILVFEREWAMRELTLLEIAAALLATGVLAAVSWYVVERPIRERSILPGRTPIFRGAAVAMAAMCLLAGLSEFAKGFPGRLPERARALDSVGQADVHQLARKHCLDAGPASGGPGQIICTTGTRDVVPSFLLWGDSHARALMPGVAAAARELNMAGVVASHPGCPPLMGVHLRGPGQDRCTSFKHDMLHRLDDPKIEQVFLVSRWGAWASNPAIQGSERGWLARDAASGPVIRNNPVLFREGLLSTVQALRRKGKEVVLVASVPEAASNVWSTLARLAWWDRARDLRPTLASYWEQQSVPLGVFLELRSKGVASTLFPHEMLCDGTHCIVQKDGELVLRDSNHLTELGALLLAPAMKQAMARGGT